MIEHVTIDGELLYVRQASGEWTHIPTERTVSDEYVRHYFALDIQIDYV